MAGRIIIMTLLAWLVNSVAWETLRGGEHPFMLVAKGNLTTSSQLFPNPHSDDPVIRTESIPIENSFGYGIELRYQIPDTKIALGISADYIRAKSKSDLIFFDESIPTEDGYVVVPIELTGYFIIPALKSSFGVFMGGGAGLYFGHRIYSIAGTEAASVAQTPGFGIHVLGGISYRFTEEFSLIAEMKFRDLQFQSTNQFQVPRAIYHATVVALPQNPLDSSVHTDGIVFQLGVAFTF